MTAAIPTREPSAVRVGNTWTWRRDDLVDYPAGTWTLKYRLKNGASHVEITAAADGSSFLVTVSAATTGGYTPGHYRWVAFVESGSERYEVGSGWIDVKPAYNDDKALDDRTFARRALESVEAVLATGGTYAQRSFQINGRALERWPMDKLRVERDKLRGEIYREELAERARNGEVVTRTLGVRFKSS